MGVEILGADFIPGQVEDIADVVNSFLPDVDNNVKLTHSSGLEEPIKFGVMDSIHATNGLTKGDADHVTNVNTPKDAEDEWPAPKQIHTFYFVKFRTFEDPKLKSKIEQVDKEIQKTNQGRFQIIEALKAKRSERSHVISQLKPLTAEDKRNRTLVDEKKKEMEPLNAALGKLKKNAVTDKGIVLCTSEEELNNLIHSLHYQIQHESNTLVEEKQLLKHIKQLEGTRDKVVANASMRAKIQDSVGQPEEIREQLKLMSGNLFGARKEKDAIRVKIKCLEEELKAIDVEILSLQEELSNVNQKKDKAYETLNELRKARDDKNACYYLNRSLLNTARDLAGKKDVAALEELCHLEVDKFMSQWCSNKAFRDDYEKRILSSLDSRQLSRDGRMRNPGEKLILLEAAIPMELKPIVVKETSKPSTDDVKTLVQRDAVAVSTTKKAQKEEVETKISVADVEDMVVGSEKSQQKPSEAIVIDAAKLKELKREEEIAKAKLALERKKKLSEKAAAKAVVRAQKEADKKLKEREKRAKRKAGGTMEPADQSEVETKSEESEEPEKPKEEAPVLPKSKEQKENFRYRKGYKGSVQLPKIIHKRKKSYPYCVWVAPAIAFVMMLTMLGYYFSLGRK